MEQEFVYRIQGRPNVAASNLRRDLIEDLPSGPLDRYRKLATFDWKILREFFERPNILKLKMQIWKTLEKDPIFRRNINEISTEEAKRITAMQLVKFLGYQYLSPEMIKWPYQDMENMSQSQEVKNYSSTFTFAEDDNNDTNLPDQVQVPTMRTQKSGSSAAADLLQALHALTVNEALSAAFPEVSIKFAIGVLTFANVLISVGTERHLLISEEAFKGKIVASLAITEIAHGSNVRGIRTTATYDKNKQEFIINTPDFEAAKCWIGNGGKTCTVTALFAQLYIDEECYGVHVFVVPLRDPKNLLPYPGILIKDMGEKIGLHGIDNGIFIFENYRIPREFLLNRFADVSIDGNYLVGGLEPERTFAVSLVILSTGRIAVMQSCMNGHINAVVTAVRYAALRKQFYLKNNEANEEVSILEYQLLQHRLFPYVAAAAVLKVFLITFVDLYLHEVERCLISSQTVKMDQILSEIHAITSSAKPLICGTGLHAIQECREACGGHGFAKASGFGALRSNADASVTFEGDNNVLQQQASKWLLTQWKNVIELRKEPNSPLGSCSFLQHHKEILEGKFIQNKREHIMNLDFVEVCYKWLITYLVQKTYIKQNTLLKQGMRKLELQNASQVYAASNLSGVYGEYNALHYFCTKLERGESSTQTILRQLGILYGLSCLSNHSTYFYEGGYAKDGKFSLLIREAILKTYSILKINIVSVIDAMAPPDFVLNSALGTADGKLYEKLEEVFLHKSSAELRPEWWQDVIVPNARNLVKRSKL